MAQSDDIMARSVLVSFPSFSRSSRCLSRLSNKPVRHLSFSEALYALWLAENAATCIEWKDDATALQMLKDPFYENTLRIGGGRKTHMTRVSLGAQLALLSPVATLTTQVN